MKFQANSKDLLAAITSAAEVIRRTNIPMMECVLLRAGDRLIVTGTNMDAQIAAECRAAITGHGAFAVNADDLKRFLASIGDTNVTVSGGDRVCFSSARAKVELFGFDAADFPPAMVADAPHEVIGADIALPLCANYAGSDPARDYLSGVRFTPQGTVATDGGRLASHPAVCPVSATIPNTAIRTITGILKAKGRLFIGETIWRAEGEGITAKGKLMDWSYPDWQRLVAGESVELGTVDADDLLGAIQSATLGQAGTVFLQSVDGGISMRGEAWAATRADATATCAAEIATPFAGAFKTANIVGALKPLSGSVLSVLCIAGNMLSLTPKGGDGRHVVVAPWRHADQSWPVAGGRVAA